MGRPILVWTAPDSARPIPTAPRTKPTLVSLDQRTAGHGAAEPVRRGFTSHDRIALTCWIRGAEARGYSRMLIEDNPDEPAPYVLVYVRGRDWARWGLTRNGARIVIWDCRTNLDIGEHATMTEALESLPSLALPNSMPPPAQLPGTRDGSKRSENVKAS